MQPAASSGELRGWCEAQRAEATRSGVHLMRGVEWTGSDLTRIWTRLYEVVHADWSPTAPTADLLEIFGPMITAELDADSTALALGKSEEITRLLPDPRGGVLGAPSRVT